ncbi:DNA-binding PadR family transcriptional regulator [Mumia flava]|uniref:DNA-binding PadR family transcriptional regulator n=1 Tax=Mumia flava TaxID=1348852 RepID=A0A0B2BSU9_9ACTN|nr:PadR family transcriptional regulator [Mumia flava]PJJ57222.1 DNA-binding PadR family transcriptional regulator [Mumia flava]
MALRDAVLAALLDGESSGYDLAKSFSAGVANFWLASPQQIYRELERMADDGLIQARLVEQERRPNKRMFSLTEAGHAALREHTATASRPTVVRDELMVKVYAVDDGDAGAVRDAISGRLEAARDKLARYERRRERMLSGRTEAEYLAATDRVGPYLTLLRGHAFERENVAWAEHALAVLDARLPQSSRTQRSR